MVLKKNQLSKFEDQIGFTKESVNQAEYNPVPRKELLIIAGKVRLLKAGWGWDKEVTNKRKGYFRQGHLPIGDSTGPQVGSCH